MQTAMNPDDSLSLTGEFMRLFISQTFGVCQFLRDLLAFSKIAAVKLSGLATEI
jgi:hypothetical protein